mmetsp:Transcript_129748/g.238620  ORF Transcript_129748/g.238620 Transcript_129748/m.238620 type:complete len:208 (+) Transcript_129748:210-833(+)
MPSRPARNHTSLLLQDRRSPDASRSPSTVSLDSACPLLPSTALLAEYHRRSVNLVEHSSFHFNTVPSIWCSCSPSTHTPSKQTRSQTSLSLQRMHFEVSSSLPLTVLPLNNIEKDVLVSSRIVVSLPSLHVNDSPCMMWWRPLSFQRPSKGLSKPSASTTAPFVVTVSSPQKSSAGDKPTFCPLSSFRGTSCSAPTWFGPNSVHVIP